MLPHLRRLPERVDRILTLTGRGELRVRSILDEDGGRIVRTLANRLLLVFAGTSFLATSAWLLAVDRRRAADRRADRAVRGVRLRRPAHRRRARPAGGCRRRPGRDDMTVERAPLDAAATATPEAASVDRRFDDVPPGERYYRHPGDVIRLVVWGLATIALAVVRRVGRGDQRRAARGPRRRRRPDPRHRPPAGRHHRPGRRHPRPGRWSSRALVARQRWRRLLHLTLAAALGFGAFVLLDARRRHPRQRRRSAGRRLLADPGALPVAGCARRGGCGRCRRQAVAGANVAPQRRPLAPRSSPSRSSSPGAPDSPRCCWRCPWARSSVPPCSSFSAPRTAGRPRVPSPPPSSSAGLPVTALTLERATGGRSQLYRADARRRHVRLRQGVRPGQPGRRPAVPRLPRACCSAIPVTNGWAARWNGRWSTKGCSSSWPGVPACGVPDLRALRRPRRRVDGPRHGGRRRRPTRHAERRAALSPELLDAVWAETRALHAAGIAHRALRAANVVVDDDGPVIVDFGSAVAAAEPRWQAFDRAELVVSLATLAGPEAATASAARMLHGRRSGRRHSVRPTPGVDRGDAPARPRSRCSKPFATRSDEATGVEPEPLERLVRVRPRTLLMIATLTGAFYFLLPQLANVDDSIDAIRSANWGWLAGVRRDVGRDVRGGRLSA